ncbi:MAG: PadR family transcriptional regulator [Candidatus Coproplasma sp.]
MTEDNNDFFNNVDTYSSDENDEHLPVFGSSDTENINVNDSAEEVENDDEVDTFENEEAETSDTVEKSEAKKEASSISADLIRGHINTIILRALYERDKYGYEIINDIESKSHGQYTLKQPTLYSALKRLETQGYIKAYWKTDEVSSGGRRKYFKLTDSGKEITEKNLAEWEYSRTIIDSLISDKSFDFQQPAPTPVNFGILRDSVSRVPVIHPESEAITNKENQSNEGQSTVQNSAVTQSEANTQLIQQETNQTTLKEITPASQNDVASNVTSTSTANTNIQNNTSQHESQLTEAQLREAEEARRRVHENYLKLISEPVSYDQPTKDNIVPNSDKIDADRLIYTNRPETERDYKNLIDTIYFRTLNNGSVQTTYHQPSRSQPQERQKGNVNILEKAQSDGVTVMSATANESVRATKTTYNKGLALLKSSSIIFAITVLEFILCVYFMKELKINWIYPSVILGLGVIQFTVFLIMKLSGYGKHAVKPTSNGYISSCIIITFIAILIISICSVLLNMNPSEISDIMTMLVIPSLTTLNLIIFSLFFKLFIR